MWILEETLQADLLVTAHFFKLQAEYTGSET